MKRCNSCGVAKPNTAYTKQKQRSGNFTYMFECKACACDRQAKRYQSYTPEQRRAKKSKSLKRLYGINIEQYEQMLIAQNDSCASCNKHKSTFSKALVVDHCHISKQVRGLLCSGCNLALGNIKEDAETLIDLAGYIRSHQCA